MTRTYVRYAIVALIVFVVTIVAINVLYMFWDPATLFQNVAGESGM